MITFKGTYFDGKSARAHEVTVTVEGHSLLIRGDGVHASFNIDRCTVEPALGNTRRTLHTPDDGRLDTEDHKAFLALERNKGGMGVGRVVNMLESRWKAVLAAAAIAILAVFAAMIWGIPYLAEAAAFSIPDKALQTLGKGALDSVDRHFFHPSELDADEQERIQSLVGKFVTETGAPEPRALVFRKSPYGPNAFAFPGDTVVLTDELVSFVEGDDELLGVVAHELAHLKRRHAARTLLQGAGAFVLVSVLVGDVASITSAAGTLPTLLLQSRYSRGFEKEADLMASRWMATAGYGVEPMIAFLTRLKEKKSTFEGPEFLSSHPAMDKRILYLGALKEEMKK